jgi:hypothetical protein
MELFPRLRPSFLSLGGTRTPNPKGGITLAVDKEQVRRKPTFLSLHDQELLAAKNSGARVRIVLACETYYTDEQAQLFCAIEKVDKYAIRVKLVTDVSIWLMKQAILSTEVVV